MTPTIKDIARILGVANSTVGRAMNDDPRISKQVKEEVRAVALQIGYVPSAAARSMRSGTSKLIGLIFPCVEFNDSATIAKGISDCCNDAGYQLVLSMSDDDPQKELEQIRSLVEARVAGIAIVPTHRPMPESLSLLKRIPFVQLIRRLPELQSEAFTFDDDAGMRLAVEHLIGLGHRRIAYLGTLDSLSTGEARLKGYREALSAHHPLDENLIVTTPPDGSAAADAFLRLFSRQAPTALVLGGSRITIEVMNAVIASRISVPRDISIVGFGDHPWSNWWGPGLTTIGLPVRNLAAATGSHLVQRIGALPKTAAGNIPSPSCISHAPNLIIRGSTAQVSGPANKR